MKLVEQLKFYFKMLLLNRRNTIIMFLGLGISLALISEGLVFMYSFQYDAFQDFTQETPTKQLSITVSAIDVGDVKNTVLSQLQNITVDSMKDIGIMDRVKRIDWFSSRGVMLVVNDPDLNGTDRLLTGFGMYSVPTDYFSALESILYNGTMPKTTSDFIVVTSESVIRNSNLTRMGLFPAYVPVFSMEADPWISVDIGIPGAGNYINVSGLITREDFSSYKGTLTDDFRALDDYFSDNFIITRFNNLVNFVESVNYQSGMLSFSCRVAFDLGKIDAFNINNEITNLNLVAQELERSIEQAGFSSKVYPEIVETLQDFREEFLVFQLFNLLFMTPLIGMALSLTNYSTNLMKRRQKRHVSNMLQRGSSRKEVLTLLTMQVVEFTIIALLLSFLIGYPFTWLMIKSNGFLNFGGVSKLPALNMVIFYVIIAAGATLSVVVNAKNVWDMSSITTDEAYGADITKKPFWEKIFLDIVLLVLGIVLWLVVRIQLKGKAAYAFAYGFGTTAPILLVLGGVLFATRLFPYFTNIIAKIGWKIPKLGIVGLSAKRSLRRKSAVVRSVVLISLTFTLIVSSMVTIQSYQEFDSEIAYYNVGGDILIRNVNVGSSEFKDQIVAMDEIENATYLKATSQIVTFGQLTYSYVVLGIQPDEFAEVGYFEKEYLDGRSPAEFFEPLNNADTVVMQRDQINQIATYANESVSIIVEKYGTSDKNYTFTVSGIYNFLPRFFVSYPKIGSSIFRFTIVGNYDLVQKCAYSSNNIAGDLLVKVKDGYSIRDVDNMLEEELGRTVDSIADLKGSYEGSLRNTMLYSSLNVSFISSLVITVSAIALMIFIQSVENEKEVVMLKTLGMSPRQLFNMFITEAMTVVLFGALIGFLTGLLSANMIMDILTFETILPPIEVTIPPAQVILAFGILLFSATVTAAITSWIVFRKDTIKAIKQI